VIAAAKMRLDFVFGDVESGYVRQRAFQAVTDLDKHFSILNEHKKNDAIPALLLTNTPCLGDTLGIVRDVRVALHLRKDRDHDLIGSFALELRQLFIEAMRSFL